MNKLLSIKLWVRHRVTVSCSDISANFCQSIDNICVWNFSPLRKIHSPENCFGHYWISQSNNKFNHIFTDMSCTSNYVACWREMHYVILKFSPGRWKKAEEILLLLHWRRDLKHRDQNIMRLDSVDLGFVIWTSKKPPRTAWKLLCAKTP